MDYAGNSRKSKEKVEKEGKEAKLVEKVVAGEVVVKKRSIGRRIKDIFIVDDPKRVLLYVLGDVLLPAARNMIVDGAHEATKRMLYGETAARYKGYTEGPRITYDRMHSNPLRSAAYRDPRVAPPPVGVRPSSGVRSSQDPGYILETRQDAELVLERMQDIIDKYDVVPVADLYELLGLPQDHTDQKWGWISLLGAKILQVREGYLLELPPPEALQ